VQHRPFFSGGGAPASRRGLRNPCRNRSQLAHRFIIAALKASVKAKIDAFNTIEFAHIAVKSDQAGLL
jgi:hypothetical protein